MRPSDRFSNAKCTLPAAVRYSGRLRPMGGTIRTACSGSITSTGTTVLWCLTATYAVSAHALTTSRKTSLAYCPKLVCWI